MKKTLALLLALVMLFSLAACGAAEPTPAEPAPAATEEPAATDAPAENPAEEPAAETVMFTDSCGREVELPANITKIAPSGTVATMILAAFAPEELVCVGTKVSENQIPYLYDGIVDLPVTGQLYGGKATLNLEELLATGAEVIIDLGDFKKSIADDLTALQEQTGLPCVFIEADLAHLADAFRTLGTILGKEERGEELAKLVEETMTMAAENSAKIAEDQRLSVLYSSGSDPLGTNAEGSSQAQALGIVGAKNAVVLEDVSNKGGGNPINLEQLYRFDPDVILFAAGSIYAAAADDAAWQPLRAIEEGDFYEIPSMPYNWLSNPPSLNMLLGIWWLGNLLYPQYYDYDMVEKTQEIFQLFWDYDLSGEEARQMLANSTLKDTP